MTSSSNAPDRLRGLAWVGCVLVTTTVLGLVVVTSLEWNLGFGLWVGWMWLAMPWFYMDPSPPDVAAIGLSLVQWILVGLWVSYQIRNSGWWRALGWTMVSVLVAGLGVLQVLRAFGFRFVFEGI